MISTYKWQVLFSQQKVSSKGKKFSLLNCIWPDFNKTYITIFSDKIYNKGDKVSILVNSYIKKADDGKTYLNVVEYNWIPE